MDLVDLTQADPAFRGEGGTGGDAVERVNDRLTVARRALGTLEELLGSEGPVSPVVRDAQLMGHWLKSMSKNLTT